jgi:hypothetical protein
MLLSDAELKLATWAADKLFVMFEKEHSRAESCRARVADYIGEIGACLEVLATGFATSTPKHRLEVPRIHGRRLETLIRGFEFVLASNLAGSDRLPSGEAKKLHATLEHALRNAEKLDYPIADYGDLSKPGGSKADLIEHLQRTAGEFLALSSLIRAAGPFQAIKSRGKA